MEGSVTRWFRKLGTRAKKWWRLRMFKRIEIQLTGPIYTCKREHLGWTISTNGGAELTVLCETCKTRLIVPHEKFIAVFNVEEPYPEPGDAKTGPVLKLVRDKQDDDKDSEDEVGDDEENNEDDNDDGKVS